MTSSWLAAWAAALSVLAAGGFALGAIRVADLWRIGASRMRLVLMVGFSLTALSVAQDEAEATFRMLKGQWGGAAMSESKRLAMTLGMLCLAGGASWDRCGHKGWLALLAMGVVIGLVVRIWA